MKNFILIAVLFVGVSGYSKAVPSPSIFFNLSERILEEAHQFVFPVKNVTSKIQPKKVETKPKTKVSEKSQESLEQLWNPNFKIGRQSLWIVAQ